jgi:hypothetical protein
MIGRPPHKGNRLRRAFQAGMSAERAAELAGCTLRYARLYGLHNGYLKPKGPGQRPRNDVLRQAIIDGYAQHRPIAEIAAEHGSTAGSVKVLAQRLGVSRSHQEAAEIRRKIPLEHAADWANMRRKGFSAIEAAAMLGITTDK